jgi:hypothetical protein
MYPKAMLTERVKIAIPKMRILSGSRNTSNPVVFMLIISDIEIISKRNAIIPISITNVAILTIFSILVYSINQIELFKNIVKKLLPISKCGFDYGGAWKIKNQVVIYQITILLIFLK